MLIMSSPVIFLSDAGCLYNAKLCYQWDVIHTGQLTQSFRARLVCGRGGGDRIGNVTQSMLLCGKIGIIYFYDFIEKYCNPSLL